MIRSDRCDARRAHALARAAPQHSLEHEAECIALVDLTRFVDLHFQLSVAGIEFWQGKPQRLHGKARDDEDLVGHLARIGRPNLMAPTSRRERGTELSLLEAWVELVEYDRVSAPNAMAAWAASGRNRTLPTPDGCPVLPKALLVAVVRVAFIGSCRRSSRPCNSKTPYDRRLMASHSHGPVGFLQWCSAAGPGWSSTGCCHR